MANFFEGVGNLLKHPLDEAQFLFDVGRGKTSLKDAPGEHQRMMNKITVPMLGDNKISKNSDAVAGAIVGGVLAAPMIGGAFGGGGSGAFELGNVNNYFKPGALSTPDTNLSSQGLGWQGGAKLDFGLGEGLDYKDMAKAVGDEGLDLAKLSKVLKSIKPADDSVRAERASRGGGGGIRFDKSLYENPLLAREFQSLYSEPLYNKLV